MPPSSPPPNFLEAIADTNGLRPSPSPFITSPAASPSLSAAGSSPGLTTDRLSDPSSEPRPRRWDDPPTEEPRGPADNTTSLLLVLKRAIQSINAATMRKEVARIHFSPDDKYLAVSSHYSQLSPIADGHTLLTFYNTHTWSSLLMSNATYIRAKGDFALSPGLPVMAVVPFVTPTLSSSQPGSYSSTPTPGTYSHQPHLCFYDLTARAKRTKNEAAIVTVQGPLAYSPDGTLLVGTSTLYPNRIMVARGQTEPIQPIRLIATHTGEVTQLAFSADGKAVVSAARDGSLRMTSIATGRTLRKFDVPMTRFDCSLMRVSRDGTLVVSIWGPEVHLWYPATGDRGGYNLNTVRTTEGWPLAISADCKYLACRTEVGVDVSNIADGQFRGDLLVENALITAAEFSHDSKYLVLGKYSGEINLVEIVTV